MAVADALTELDPAVRITALGTARGLETRLVPERGYQLELITPVPLPRKPNGDLMRLPLRVRRAVRETRAILDRVEADVIVGFGGYVALPAYLAARGGTRRRRRVPVVIHEANASAGLANRVGARRAERVLSAVPDSGLRHAEVVGVPVRSAITALDRIGDARRGARAFRPRRRRAGAAGVRRLTGGRVDQRGRRRRSETACCRRHFSAARTRAEEPAEPAAACRGRTAVRRGAVPDPDGPRLCRGRPGDLPVGRDDGGRGLRGRAASGLRAVADRQRRTASQRVAGGQRGRRADRGRSATSRRTTSPTP